MLSPACRTMWSSPYCRIPLLLWAPPRPISQILDMFSGLDLFSMQYVFILIFVLDCSNTKKIKREIECSISICFTIHNTLQPLKGIMMEILYKEKIISVLGHPLFTHLSSNRHHRGLKEAEHRSPNQLFPLF